jgi:hypothetical protein
MHSKPALYRGVLQVQVRDLDRTLVDLTNSIERLFDDKVAA